MVYLKIPADGMEGSQASSLGGDMVTLGFMNQSSINAALALQVANHVSQILKSNPSSLA